MKKTIFKSKLWVAALAIASMPTLCSCADKGDVNATASIEAPAEVSQEAKPEISFEKSEFDFGEIKQGDKVEHTFSFTNTGTTPLVISGAKASCGCTVPEWPKEAIAPGQTGEIHVVFNSRGKSGRQNKSIRISTNISETPAVIYLKGNVTVPAQPATTPAAH